MINDNVLLIQGVDVKAPWKGSPDATNTISGTSMAAPHVVSIYDSGYSYSIWHPVDTECAREAVAPWDFPQPAAETTTLR